MDLNTNMKIIINRFGNDYRCTKGENQQMMYCCPFCESRRGKPDRSFKLYVSIRKLKFICFKCGARGRLKRFVSESNSQVYNNILDIVNNKQEEDEEDNMFYIPNIKVPKDTVAYKYLINRGINDEMIDYYNIRFGIDDLAGRIIVPNIVYSSTWTDMYQARSYINQIPKYVNPPDSNKSHSVFNLHRMEKGGVCNVVEGAITSICAGKDSCGIYGSSPSDIQVASIISHEFEEINCVLDNDPSGRKGNLKLAQMLSNKIVNNRTKINIVTMPPGIDAADIGSVEFHKYVNSHKTEFDSKVYAKIIQLKGK